MSKHKNRAAKDRQKHCEVTAMTCPRKEGENRSAELLGLRPLNAFPRHGPAIRCLSALGGQRWPFWVNQRLERAMV